MTVSLFHNVNGFRRLFQVKPEPVARTGAYAMAWKVCAQVKIVQDNVILNFVRMLCKVIPNLDGTIPGL